MKLFLIISLLCFLKLVSSDIKCHRSYYRSNKVTAVKLGYCWMLVNANFTMESAFKQCSRFNARLPSVNTISKAKKLAKFFADSRALFVNGEYGPNYARIYKQGWPAGDDLWVSDIANGMWRSTKIPVTSAAAQDKTLLRQGEHCVLFNYRTSTWRYTSCGGGSGLHPTICEEKNHLYADEGKNDARPIPPATLAPTSAPPPGSVASCPTPYQLLDNRCFAMGKKRGTIMHAEKMCTDMGGKQYWISEPGKISTVVKYLRSQKNFKYGAWLSRLEGKGHIIKWKSSGTNAWDTVQKFHPGRRGFMKKPEPKLYILVTGRVSLCREARNCLPLHPLCVADVVWHPKSKSRFQVKKGSMKADDYYDDDDYDE